MAAACTKRTALLSMAQVRLMANTSTWVQRAHSCVVGRAQPCHTATWLERPMRGMAKAALASQGENLTTRMQRPLPSDGQAMWSESECLWCT